MKKKYVTVMLVVMVLLIIAGIILIFNAYNIGDAVFIAKLQANGGIWVGEGLDRIRDNTIRSSFIVGIILSAIGGIGGITFAYGIYKHLED